MLIAFVVFCHGFVYVRIGSMLPAPVKGWKGTSWLLGDAISHPSTHDVDRLCCT